MTSLENLNCNEYNDAYFAFRHISKEKYVVYIRTLERNYREKISRGGVEKKMKFTKLIRNKKAISPIFATLILIAIAVIAGIVVYMFTSGTLATMTGGGTAGQEKVNIQAIAGNASASTTDTITVYAMSTGGGPVALDSAIVKDAQGTVLEVIADTEISPATINADLTTLTITVPANTLTAGQSYTVTLVSVAGGNFPSQSFKAVAGT